MVWCKRGEGESLSVVREGVKAELCGVAGVFFEMDGDECCKDLQRYT